ncbi:MAG: hypothetical protein R3305_00270 [Gammaproteobacteria bacterium]|nr:hypothetical protein [Gammaproteobacteria bacterium]
MKYLLSFVLGVAAGGAIALAALFFNPLTRAQSDDPSGAAWTLRYSVAPSDVLISTHDRSLGLPLVPSDAPLLWEQGIKGSVLTVMPLSADEAGSPAWATRISVPATDTDLLTAGVLVDDYWLVSVPGRGSVLVHSVSNHWPLLRDSVVRVDWLKQAWPGSAEYTPTRGPNAAAAAVVGLSGEFAGAEGRAWERVALKDYNGRFSGLAGQLLLDLGGAPR